MGPPTPRHHFLVIAAASRGARFFVKKALQQGHSVTAICRALDDADALARMQALLDKTPLTHGGLPSADTPGIIQAFDRNIFDPETYQMLLNQDTSIDRVCCFVGVTSLGEMLNRDIRLYSQTIQALITGMNKSRWVEFYYHGSSGTEGIPGKNKPRLPDNFRLQWLLNLGLNIPAAQDCFKSEGLLAEATGSGMKFVVFRPAWLTNGAAGRSYGYCFDITGWDNERLPLRNAKMTISREDVAEEILRVSTLPDSEREMWFGHGVYLVDMKK